MGWTVNQSRRRSRLRHRPHLEHLDDRCLLSTGLGIQSTAWRRRGSPRANTRPGPARDTATSRMRREPISWSGINAVVAKHRERPAGTLIDRRGRPPTTQSSAPPQVRSTYNVNGTGMTVAVIDTGVDYNNSALGGAFGPGYKVVAGYDFADNSANPMATTSQHGTAVAGLIGSDDPSDLGVAPGVDIVALRVTDSTNTASLTSIANALQWVINNHAQYNITAVNMSLSDGNNYAQNWFASGGGVGRADHQPDRPAHRDEHPGGRGDGQQLQRAARRGLRGDRRQHDQRDGDRPVRAISSRTPSGSVRRSAALGHHDRRAGRGLHRPVGRLRHLHGRRNQLRHARWSPGRRPAPADLRVPFRDAPHGRPAQVVAPAGSDPINDPVTGITIGRARYPQGGRPDPAGVDRPDLGSATATVATGHRRPTVLDRGDDRADAASHPSTVSTATATTPATTDTAPPAAHRRRRRPADERARRCLEQPESRQHGQHRDRASGELSPRSPTRCLEASAEGHERLGRFVRIADLELD